MIVGIGVDIVEIDRIASSWTRFGERFAEKILCEDEMRRFRESADPVAWLAKRFAAKEAVSKALGTGMRAGVHFGQIGIGGTAGHAPVVALTGAAAARAEKLGVTGSKVSISDETHYAVAFAVLERV